MHIPDGLLPPAVSAGGYILSGAALWGCTRMISRKGDISREVPRASILTAVFFAVSLLHLPIPPLSIHLMLNGFMGVLLGWFALPAIIVGLFFQVIMFGHGGLTSLGTNAVIIGFPALLSGWLFRTLTRNRSGRRLKAVAAFLGGACGPAVSALLLAVLLHVILPMYGVSAGLTRAMYWLPLSYLPLAVVEGLFTYLTVSFLLKVSPGVLDGSG